MWGSGFIIWGLGFRDEGVYLGFRDEGLGCRVHSVTIGPPRISLVAVLIDIFWGPFEIPHGLSKAKALHSVP